MNQTTVLTKFQKTINMPAWTLCKYHLLYYLITCCNRELPAREVTSLTEYFELKLYVYTLN